MAEVGCYYALTLHGELRIVRVEEVRDFGGAVEWVPLPLVNGAGVPVDAETVELAGMLIEAGEEWAHILEDHSE